MVTPEFIFVRAACVGWELAALRGVLHYEELFEKGRVRVGGFPWQMVDAGTKPGPDAVLRLVEDMQYNPQIGGCCGQIAVDIFPCTGPYLNPVVAGQVYEVRIGGATCQRAQAEPHLSWVVDTGGGILTGKGLVDVCGGALCTA